jgi:hypothetical protein
MAYFRHTGVVGVPDTPREPVAPATLRTPLDLRADAEYAGYVMAIIVATNILRPEAVFICEGEGMFCTRYQTPRERRSTGEKKE